MKNKQTAIKLVYPSEVDIGKCVNNLLQKGYSVLIEGEGMTVKICPIIIKTNS